MNIDGSNQTRLTNTPGTASYPTVAPSGNRIAFVSDRDSNNELYVMNADGSSQINITNSPASDHQPSWQRVTLPPTLGADSTTLVAGETTATINVLANDSADQYAFETLNNQSLVLTSQPTLGTASVDTVNGNVTFTINEAALRAASAATNNDTVTDSFTYQICSTANDQLCSEAAVTLTIAALRDPALPVNPSSPTNTNAPSPTEDSGALAYTGTSVMTMSAISLALLLMAAVILRRSLARRI